MSMDILEIGKKVFIANGLITAFLFVGVIVWISYGLSRYLTRGRIHGSAVAILCGLVLAYIGGAMTGGQRGFADIPLFAGIAVMGGGMLRDYAIVATAFGARLSEMKKAGLAGLLSLIIGVILSYVAGAAIAYAFGYHDAKDVATIAAGAVTFIVGPVTGTALGVSSDVIALSIAAGVFKSILIMVLTPWVAPYIGLNNPQAAMVYGGLMGSTSGVVAGLAATDSRLVPYGAFVANFYTGLGCLACPTILYFTTAFILGQPAW